MLLCLWLNCDHLSSAQIESSILRESPSYTEEHYTEVLQEGSYLFPLIVKIIQWTCMDLETLQVRAIQVGTCRAGLLLRMHTWGGGKLGARWTDFNLWLGKWRTWSHICFNILNLSYFSFCFLPCFCLVILLSRAISKRQYLNSLLFKSKI